MNHVKIRLLIFETMSIDKYKNRDKETIWIGKMGDEHLLYKVEDHIALFTINREKQRNSISVEAIGLFMEYLDRAEANPQRFSVIDASQDQEQVWCQVERALKTGLGL